MNRLKRAIGSREALRATASGRRAEESRRKRATQERAVGERQKRLEPAMEAVLPGRQQNIPQISNNARPGPLRGI